MKEQMAEDTGEKSGGIKGAFNKLWRVITVGSLATGAAGCDIAAKKSQTPIPESTPIVQTYTPPTETSTPIPTEAPTETPTPTEVPRFENLIPATIEECKAENVIRLDHLQEDMETLHKKEMEKFDSSKKLMGDYSMEPGIAGKNGLLNSKLLVYYDTTYPASCSFLKEGSREFLILGFYTYINIPDKDNSLPASIEVVHFAFDINRKDPGFDDSYYEKYVDLKSPEVYSAIINHNYKQFYVTPIWTTNDGWGQTDENLAWLFEYQKANNPNYPAWKLLPIAGGGLSITQETYSRYLDFASTALYPAHFINLGNNPV